MALGGFISPVYGNDSHTAAVKNDGTVWTWGGNSYGQLGDGTTITKTTPVQVAGLTGVIAISTGSYHTAALKNDGTVWTWGANMFGQLGPNYSYDSDSNEYYYLNSSVPFQVPGLTNVIAIDAGPTQTTVIKNDGTVWTWGGDNGMNPAQVSGLTNVIALSSGNGQYTALKSDGTVWEWVHTPSTGIAPPVQVSGLTGITAIAGRKGDYRRSFALKNDGIVWTWSYEADGTQNPTVQVPDFTDVIDIAAGGYHTLVIKCH